MMHMLAVRRLQSIEAMRQTCSRRSPMCETWQGTMWGDALDGEKSRRASSFNLFDRETKAESNVE